MQRYDIKDIKVFSLGLVTFLSLVSIKLSKTGKIFSVYLNGIAVMLFILTVLAPRLILPLYKIFSFLGKIIGWIVANIILLLIFYLIFTPIGLLAKLMHRDVLGLKKTGQESYWVKNSEVFSRYRYTKQF